MDGWIDLWVTYVPDQSIRPRGRGFQEIADHGLIQDRTRQVPFGSGFAAFAVNEGISPRAVVKGEAGKSGFDEGYSGKTGYGGHPRKKRIERFRARYCDFLGSRVPFCFVPYRKFTLDRPLQAFADGLGALKSGELKFM